MLLVDFQHSASRCCAAFFEALRRVFGRHYRDRGIEGKRGWLMAATVDGFAG